MQDDKAIRFPQLQEMVPASRSTIFRWERDGLFPKHFRLGKNSVAWSLKAVEAWLAQRSKGE